MRWQEQDIKLSTVSIIPASQSKAVISYESLPGADPCTLRADAQFSALTAGTGVSLILQDWNGSTWRDVKTVAVTTTGVSSIFINLSVDSAVLPLSDRVRVVLTTGVGSSATVADVRLYRLEA